MIVLDTHVWIWVVEAPERLSRIAMSAVASADKRCISAVSCWELATLDRLGRLRLDNDAQAWIARAVQAAQVQVQPVTCGIARLAGEMDDLHGDPADRLIAATAIHHEAQLVTKDQLLRSSEQVTTIW